MLLDRPRKSFNLSVGAHSFADHIQLNLEVFVSLDELADPGAGLALDQGFDRTIGQPQQLQHRADDADAIDVLFGGIIDSRFALGGQKDLLILGVHGAGQGGHGFWAADKQRGYHVREDHDIPQRQQGKHLNFRLTLIISKKACDIHHLRSSICAGHVCVPNVRQRFGARTTR